MTIKERIKMKYAEIEGKTKFIEDLAEVVDRSPLTIRNNWFSAFWMVPEENQEIVLDFLDKKIQEQKTETVEK